MPMAMAMVAAIWYGKAKVPTVSQLTHQLLYIFSVRICESPDSISMTMPNPSDTFKPDRSKYCKAKAKAASFYDHVHGTDTQAQLM